MQKYWHFSVWNKSTGPGRSLFLNESTPITYFNNYEIKIEQIFVNPFAYGSFFITKDDKLYVCGRNKDDGILGLVNDGNLDYVFEPTLVPDLKNIIDIKSASEYSIAIC